MLSDDLARAIASWTEQDPDPQTRQQLDDLLTAANSGDARAMAELVDAFSSRLQFGTAGLRGALGPGPNRMNRVVVGQTTAGLAGYLLDQGLAGGKVIIGFDARYNSDVFARDTAEIMSGAGFQTMITSRTVADTRGRLRIRHLGCVAGVVVTASHNPPQDNGYKVFLGDGSQIVPPADVNISSRIEEVAEHSLNDVPRSQSYAVLGEELVAAYLDRIASLVPPMRRVNCAGSTPHCTAWAAHWWIGRWRLAGFRRPCGRRAGQPGSGFPTVPFPNPEEPGAIDLALARARRSARTGDRQRPGCRPLCGSRDRGRTVADAAG